MSLLAGVERRHGVDLEGLARTVLRDWLRQRGAFLDATKTEDSLSFLIGTVWELSYLYDPPGFGAVQALKRRMRALAGKAGDELRPLERLAVVERNVRDGAGDRTFELNLRHRYPGPGARECWELARRYPRYRRWLVSQKRLKEVPDYGLDFCAEVRGMGLECKALDMSFSTYGYRIGLRRVTDWFRGWGGDARYGQDVKPESLELRRERDRDEVGGEEPGLEELLTSIDLTKLRPVHRKTLRHVAKAVAAGMKLSELHESHPEWSTKQMRDQMDSLAKALDEQGIRPAVLLREEEAVAA